MPLCDSSWPRTNRTLLPRRLRRSADTSESDCGDGKRQEVKDRSVERGQP